MRCSLLTLSSQRYELIYAELRLHECESSTRAAKLEVSEKRRSNRAPKRRA